jgi:flotillin
MSNNMGLAFLLLQTNSSETAKGVYSILATPIMILLVVLALGALMRTLAHRYVKVPPQKALIIYGGGKTRVVSGGAKFVMPFVEDFFFLDLSLFQFPVELTNVPNKDSVPVNVKTSVSAKISNKEEMLPVAAGIFGELSLKEIALKVQGIVDGHIRALIGQSEMETILRDQDTFKQQISNLVSAEMSKIGCEIIVLNIQEVSDPHGVIESLGKPKIAEIKAEAEIKQAEQTRRQTIEVTNAQREAQKVAASNNAQIAEANRDLKTKEAGYNAEIARQNATAAQAGPLAEAEARKAVVVAEVAVKEAQTEAETKLQDKVKAKTKAELDATVLTQAEAEKQRSVIVAEGTRQATIITAEGNQRKLVIEAEGAAEARQKAAAAAKTALEAEGQGEAAKALAVGNAAADVREKTGKANAAATEAQMLADAKGKAALADATKQELLAQAEGLRATGLARAAGIEAELVAQATGVAKMLENFQSLTPEQVKMLQTKWILEALPGAIQLLGEAGEKIMAEVAKPIAAAIGSIDQVTVYDSGSNNGDGSGLERFAKLGPQALLQAFLSLRETGVVPMVMEVLKKVGVDVSSLQPAGTVPEDHPRP